MNTHSKVINDILNMGTSKHKKPKKKKDKPDKIVLLVCVSILILFCHRKTGIKNQAMTNSNALCPSRHVRCLFMEKVNHSLECLMMTEHGERCNGFHLSAVWPTFIDHVTRCIVTVE